MHNTRVRVLVLLLLSVVVPTTVHAQTRPSSTQPKLIKTEPNKPLVHAASGFVFPFNVGAFRRSVAYTFDDAGNNLSVGYSDPSLKIIMTAYVYPTLGVPMDAHFKQTKADIVRVNAKAKLTKEGGITITQGKRQYEGQHARYEYIGLIAGVEHDVVSEAYVFVHGKNFVKFRLTYPAADAKAAAIRVEFFLSALAFPEK